MLRQTKSPGKSWSGSRTDLFFEHANHSPSHPYRSGRLPGEIRVRIVASGAIARPRPRWCASERGARGRTRPGRRKPNRRRRVQVLRRGRRRFRPAALCIRCGGCRSDRQGGPGGNRPRAGHFPVESRAVGRGAAARRSRGNPRHRDRRPRGGSVRLALVLSPADGSRPEPDATPVVHPDRPRQPARLAG